MSSNANSDEAGLTVIPAKKSSGVAVGPVRPDVSAAVLAAEAELMGIIEKRAMLAQVARFDVLDYVNAGQIDVQKMKETGAGKVIKKLKFRRFVRKDGVEETVEMEFEGKLAAIELDARLSGELKAAEEPKAVLPMVPAEHFEESLARSPAAREALAAALRAAEAKVKRTIDV